MVSEPATTTIHRVNRGEVLRCIDVVGLRREVVPAEARAVGRARDVANEAKPYACGRAHTLAVRRDIVRVLGGEEEMMRSPGELCPRAVPVTGWGRRLRPAGRS